MAEPLTVVLNATDNISPAFAQIAANSTAAMDSMAAMGSAGDSAMNSVVAGMQSALDALNSFSSGADGLADAMGTAAGAADGLADATQDAAQASREWAEADRLASQAAEQLHMSLDAAPEAAQKLTDAMRESEEAISALSDEQQAAVQANEEYQAALEEAEAALSAQQEAFAAAEQAAREYDEAMIAGVSSTEELEAMAEKAMHAGEDLAEANGRCADAADRLREATQGAIDEVEALGETSEETSESTDNLGESIKDLLETLGLAFGLSEFISYLDECIQKSAEFENALAKVSTIADTSKASMGQIRSEIVALSNETGDSVTALSEATYQAISASVDTASAVEFVGQASKLAAAGYTEQSTAVDVLSTAINAYGLEASDAARLSDYLITTQNEGKTSVNELASSMGKVIPLAAAYGVEMDNLSTIYAELTKGGIATAEATTYQKAMFSELGSTTSEVAGILMDMTGSTFPQLMEQGYSVGDVMQMLGDSVNGDATAFANLWSSQEAGVGALALYNAGAEQFNTTLGKMQNSAGATAAAYDTMNNTMADSFEDMQNAFDNLGIAIGDALAPIVGQGVSIITEFVSWLAQAASACPALTVGITAAGVAAGVAAVAFKAFGVSLQTALGPIGWIAAAIGAVVTICTALENAVDEDVKKYNEATASSRQYADEMNRLQGEYDALVESVGEEAAAQSDLAAELEVARAAYEGMYESMDEFIAKTDAVIESSEQLSASINDQMSAVGNQGNLAQAYINKLTQIGSKSKLTAADTQLMSVMYGKLKEIYPDLTASMDDFIGASDDVVASIEAQTDAMNAASKMDAYSQIYADATEGMADLEVQIEAVKQEMELVNKELDNADYTNVGELKSQYAQLEERLESLTGQHSELESKANVAYSMAADAADEYAEAEQRTADAAREAIAAMSDEDAAAVIASGVFDTLSAEIMDVAQKHDELAQSISDAVDSQISSFKRFEADGSQSIANATANIQASIDTMRAQTENVTAVHDYLVNQMHYTEEAAQLIMTDMIQPTAEGAGLAADAAQTVRDAVSGSAEAAGQFSEYATSMLQKGQEVEAYGQTMADVADDMGGKMEEIAQLGEETINSLEGLPEGVKSKAVEAFTGFTTAIADAQGPATEAANKVGDEAGKKAATALAQSGKECRTVMDSICRDIESAAAACKPKITVQVDTSQITAAKGAMSGLSSGAPTQHNALGTTHADNIFVAGESGPELVIGAGGSTVVPAAETAGILRGVGDLAEALGKSRESMPDMSELAGTMPREREDNENESVLSQLESLADMLDRVNTLEPLNEMLERMDARQETPPEPVPRYVQEVTDSKWMPDISSYTSDILRAVTDALSTSDAPETDEPQTDISEVLTDVANALESVARAMSETSQTVIVPQAEPTAALPQIQTESMPERTTLTLDDLRKITDISQTPAARREQFAQFMPDAAEDVRPVFSGRPGDVQSRNSTCTININGAGEITVDSQIAPEKIVNIISENLRPLLLDIVKSEVYEEGNGTYTF